MRPHFVLALSACFASGAPAQQQTTAANSPTAKIPIRQLSPPDAIARDTLRAISGLKQFADGRVIVNDTRRRRLIVYDSTLTAFTVTADSSGKPSLYPASANVTNIFEYIGDSALFPDYVSQAFLLIEPGGRIGRAVAHPKPSDMYALGQPYAGTPAFDRQGRLIYRRLGGETFIETSSPPPLAPQRTRDTLAIVRADFESRAIDTIAQITLPPVTYPNIVRDSRGVPSARQIINPIQFPPDEWVVTSDGTLAIVQPKDYHIDWVSMNGARVSTPKMPFDWRRLTDADKQARIDSVKQLIDSLKTTASPFGMIVTGRPGMRGLRDTVFTVNEFVPYSEMPDYVPPFRASTVKADRDNNVWVPPTTTYASANGGVIYDVINKKGEIFERVIVPAGREIAGFGPGGIVYLISGNRDKGFVLERRHILRVGS